MMTSATQSNSGASAYLGYLYAFAGSARSADGEKFERIPKVQGQGQAHSQHGQPLVGQFRLAERLVSGKTTISYDAMVNYEAVIIES